MKTATIRRTLLTTAGLLGLAAQAHAVPMLRLTAGSGETTTITDNAGGDLHSDEGAVTFSGALGDWALNVTTGISKPVFGSATQPTIDLLSVNVTSLAGGELTIEFTDTDFWLDGTGRALADIGGSTTLGTISSQAYFDASNTAFGQGTLIADLGTFSSSSFSKTEGGIVEGSGLFSLTSVVTISHETAALTSFDAMTRVPEPASLLLLGAGLVLMSGASFIGRRRRSDSIA